MKRILTITFITLLTVANTHAQRGRVHTAGQSSASYNAELRQIQKFDHQLDKFSYSMMVGDTWAAKKNKSKIIRAMENEIWETRKELNQLSGHFNEYSKRGNNQVYRGRNGGVYSKNNGRRVHSYREQMLVEKLEKQIRIKNQFEFTELTRFRRAELVNERVHRKLMYRFRDTMTEGLNYNKGERRG